MGFSFIDTMMNFVSRLGVQSADKAQNTTYTYTPPDRIELEAAYRTSWLARKVIDIPAWDMTREWRAWSGDVNDDIITGLENEEKRLGLSTKVCEAMQWARLYGGGAIVLAVDGQGDPEMPLDITKVGMGQFKFAHVVTKLTLTPEEQFDLDPMSPTFGGAKMWLLAANNRATLRIHPTRVIRFLGNKIPPNLQYDGWGDPVWSVFKDPIVNVDTSAAAISSLLQEAKVDVINVPGLMESIGNADYESKLLRRFSMAMMSKSINNAILLDGGNGDGKSGEVFTQKQINMGGLPDILRLFIMVAAGAADIPVTRLVGKSPDGMNATGDADIRNYYDMLSSRQELEMWPNIKPIDELMFRNLGIDGSQIGFESNSLWQITPLEKATINKTNAEALNIHSATGLIPEDALMVGLLNQLYEDGVYPGLEDAVANSASLLAAPAVKIPGVPAATAAAQAAKEAAQKTAAGNDTPNPSAN